MALKPFNETIRLVRHGVMIDEATDKLAEIVHAVESTGKVGKLTIELTVKKLHKNGTLEIADRITAKIPQEETATTLVYSTPEGNLITEDPRQNKLELKTLENKVQPLKQIGAN